MQVALYIGNKLLQWELLLAFDALGGLCRLCAGVATTLSCGSCAVLATLAASTTTMSAIRTACVLPFLSRLVHFGLVETEHLMHHTK